MSVLQKRKKNYVNYWAKTDLLFKSVSQTLINNLFPLKIIHLPEQFQHSRIPVTYCLAILINIVLSTSYFLYKLANCNCTGISMPEHVKISTVMVWSYHASCNWHGMIIPMQLQLAWYDHTCPSWWKNSFKLRKKFINYKKIHENL